VAHWTKNNIPDLSGKVFIVTGANSGMGYESTFGLAEKGATVIMACRNLERAQRALETIRQAVPQARLEPMELDLASLESIQAFADSFNGQYDRLDGLINNGGPIIAAHSVTADGFESHFGINHLGHFALTGQLLNLLLNTPSSRVVTMSSRMHVDGKMEWDDLMSTRSYNAMAAYRQSKLANLLFAIELGRRLEAKGSSTMSVAAHPGLANTNWVDNNLDGFMKLIAKVMSNTSYQSAAMGALPVLYAATDPNVKPGGYYGPEHDKKGYPVEVRAGDAAYDERDAQRLWQVSEELTGVQFDALTS
jgi:NAD(P)-dependent dehydrogenase (short-subunit alcohol dehydrogenase family)